MEDIVNIIQNVGFPIAIVVYLLFRDSQKDKEHAEEVAKLAEAINNNTLVMTQIKDKLDK